MGEFVLEVLIDGIHAKGKKEKLEGYIVTC